MSDVEFEDKNIASSFRSRVIFGQPQTPAMVKSIMKVIPFADEKKAGYILLSITALFFLLSFIIFYITLHPSTSKGVYTPIQTGAGSNVSR